MIIKSKYKKFWNLKAFVLTFQIAFIFCFFIGIFRNYGGGIFNSVRIQVYDQDHRFYINRGLPIAWAGVSAANKSVEFPIIKTPFITKELPQNGSRWNKIIDLSVFVPLFSLVFLISYILMLLFIKISGKNKRSKVVFVSSFLILLLGSIYTYFFWFPRI